MPASLQTRRPLQWIPVVALLLIDAFIRLHHLLALPLFIDETIYIERAQWVREGHLLNAAVSNGRLLHVWVNALLGPYPPAAAWIVRAGVVLITLLGAAAFYALARGLISHRGGLIALALWIAAPYLAFYDRLALADPVLNALSVVAVWVAWQMMRRQRIIWAGTLGVMLVVLLLAKASGMVWLPLPLVALVLIEHGSLRQRLTLGAAAYGVFAALWGPFMLVMRLKNYDYFGVTERFIGGANQNSFERVWNNLGNLWQFDLHYLSLPVIVFAAAGGLIWLRQRPRPALFALMALGMAAGGAVVFGRDINPRYALNHAAWVLLALAAGLDLLIQRRPRWQPVIYAALALWGLIFGAPFVWQAWDNPADLPLVRGDQQEYLMYDSSGYGVTEIGERLRDSDDPLPIVGLVSNCQLLRLSAYPRPVMCPQIYWDSTNQGKLIALIERQAAQSAVYVVTEKLTQLDQVVLPQPNTLIITVERPGGIVPVYLYRIEQGAAH